MKKRRRDSHLCERSLAAGKRCAELAEEGGRTVSSAGVNHAPQKQPEKQQQEEVDRAAFSKALAAFSKALHHASHEETKDLQQKTGYDASSAKQRLQSLQDFREARYGCAWVHRTGPPVPKSSLPIQTAPFGRACMHQTGPPFPKSRLPLPKSHLASTVGRIDR